MINKIQRIMNNIISDIKYSDNELEKIFYEINENEKV